MKKNISIPSNIAGAGTIEKYLSSKYYNDFVFDKQYYPYIFDSINNTLYGLRDAGGDIVYPKENYLKQIKSGNGIYKNLFFVVDAFVEFKKHYDNYLNINKLEKNANIYGIIEHSGGAKFIDELYIPYINIVYGNFKQYLEGLRVKKVKSFNDFILIFTQYLKASLEVAPVTRSGFVESNFCGREVNGLYISLDAGSKPNTNEGKIGKYINDANFDTFLETARTFGFLVDKDYPWRIVADLESPAMRQFYEPYGLKSKQDIYDKLYFKAHASDMDVLRAIIITFWNTYVENSDPVIEVDTILCCDKSAYTITQVAALEQKMFDRYYDDSWFIRFYVYVKILENKIVVTQNNYESFVKEAILINKYNGKEQCSNFINNRIKAKKPTTDKNTLTALEEFSNLAQTKGQSSFATSNIKF